MDYELSTLIVNMTTLIILLGSVYLVSSQISKEHEWNRRKAAQDLTSQIIHGELLEIRRKLDVYAEWYAANHTYLSVVRDDNRKELDHLLKVYLSYFEGVALGIKHNIYDEDIAFEYFGAMIPEAYRWAQPFVLALREKAKDETIFIELITLAERWQKRSEELKRKLKEATQTKGKRPL